MPNDFMSSYGALLPEIILVVGTMALLMIGVFREEKGENLVSWLALVVLIGCGVALTQVGGGEIKLFNGSFIFDGFARFMKLLTVGAVAVTLYMSRDFLKSQGMAQSEFPVLVLFATVGMLLMISAGDLVTLYVGLELQSLALYVIAAFRREAVRSSEAGLKYFVLGALSSGMLLYGSSLIYGFTGSVNFSDIATAAQQTGADSAPNFGLIFGLVFVLAALAFKISAVPFHMWTPDVYEGAPTPVTAFFASAPKVAALALLARVSFEAFPSLTEEWQQIIIFVSIASMMLGAFAAIGQKNIKRLMAYSSIGHIGFALMGMAAGSINGLSGTLAYISLYVVMTLGAFACIMAMRRDGGVVETIEDLSGLAQNNLYLSVVIAVLFLSLAGIPPLAGFFAKLYVLSAAINAGLYPLAIFGVLSSVVAAYYYLRIIKIMFFDDPAESFDALATPLRVITGLSAIVVLFYMVAPSPLFSLAQDAAKSLF